MNLNSQIELQGQVVAGQLDKQWHVIDTKYGDVISQHDTAEEAEHAARARPYSKVVSVKQAVKTKNLNTD